MIILKFWKNLLIESWKCALIQHEPNDDCEPKEENQLNYKEERDDTFADEKLLHKMWPKTISDFSEEEENRWNILLFTYLDGESFDDDEISSKMNWSLF